MWDGVGRDVRGTVTVYIDMFADKGTEINPGDITGQVQVSGSALLESRIPVANS